jgi:uncharacterized Fe-S center protein
MGEKNRLKKVTFFTDINKLGNALKEYEIKSFSDKKVPVKLHMGEIRNKFYPKPGFIKNVVDELKKYNSRPYLYDTTVSYSGLRHYVSGYQHLAKIHGFTMKNIGCDVIIDDSGIIKKIENREFEVAWHIINSTNIFAVSHIKAHIATGIGGAIKNFGMGGVTKETKTKMHHGSRPIIHMDSCTFCGVCAEVCPFDAIRINKNKWKKKNRSCFGCGVCVDNCEQKALKNIDADIQYLIACAAKACVEDKKVIYLNELKRISDSCDCDPFAKNIICPDIGYLVSDDAVAIDKASLDLINNIKPDVFLREKKVNPAKQINYGEKIGLGTTNYELIEL